jgi:hypothetical protein
VLFRKQTDGRVAARATTWEDSDPYNPRPQGTSARSLSMNEGS